MLVLAYILLALAVACALHQRARRKAAEWDTDSLRSLYRQSQDGLERVCGERDEARAEADRLERTVGSCRLHASQAIEDRDKLAGELADARRELETARQHHQMTLRSKDNAIGCGLAREKLAEASLRDALSALGRSESP